MRFKIDTKENYTAIIPQSETIDANLTGDLLDKCEELGQSGSQNYIIDLTNCKLIAKSAYDGLTALHEYCYDNQQSLVFLIPDTLVSKDLRRSDTGMLINIAPTEKEALDIISMEILERDLYNEES